MIRSQVEQGLRPPDDWTDSPLSRLASLELNPDNAAHARKILEAAKERRASNWPQVRAAFDAVPLKTSFIYTTAITAAARCGALHEGVSLLTEMRTTGLSFTGPTYTSAINLYGRPGHYAEARIIWDQMIAEGIPVESPSATALMNAAATAGNLVATEAMLRELPSYGLKASNPQYGCLLKACRHHGNARRALEVLAEMRSAGVPPQGVQYTIAVGACRTAMERSDPEAVGIAREMQAAMDAEGILPSEWCLEEILSITLRTNIKHVRSPGDVSALDPEAVKGAAEMLAAARSRGVRMSMLLQRINALLRRSPASPPRATPAEIQEPAVKWRVELRESGQSAMVFWNTVTGDEFAGRPVEGWAEVPSPEHGRPYFCDMATGATTWDRPTVRVASNRSANAAAAGCS